MAHNIFLSYSRKDLDVMRRLRDDLIAAGFTVWTDEGIEPGTPSWKNEIERAIRESDCQVIIFSPDANNSRWVRAEIDFADTLQKPMFPVLARGDQTTSVPLGFSTYQWIDIRKPADYESGFRMLADAISNRLNRAGDTPPAQPRRLAESLSRRPARQRGGRWIAGAVAAVAVLSVLAAIVLRPDIPASAPQSTEAVATEPLASTRAPLATPGPRTRPTIPGSLNIISCDLLSEMPTYEQVNSPTIPIPEGWVQVRTDTVALAFPEEYYRPTHNDTLGIILSSLMADVLPEFMRFGCDWHLEIFFLQMSGIRGGAVVSRRIGVQLPLEAQQLYFEEGLQEAASLENLETEVVTLPAGEALRLEITVDNEILDTKMIGYSIAHGTALYALSFAFSADTIDEHLELIDQIARTLRFIDE